MNDLKTIWPNFEARQAQIDMAFHIEQAILNQEHILIEAGTGTGKTLAYCYPVLKRIRELEKPVVIATSTLNLQDQLIDKDLPVLVQLFKAQDIPITLAKGRSNYVCWSKLNQGQLWETPAQQELIQWALSSASGDLAEAPASTDIQTLHSLACESEGCSTRFCQFKKQCFLIRSRQKTKDAQIIVTNHHLLLRDLAQPEESRILPDYGLLIVDEAHLLADAVRSTFSLNLYESDLYPWYQLSSQILPLVESENKDKWKELAACFYQQGLRFFQAIHKEFSIKEDIEFNASSYQKTLFDMEELLHQMRELPLKNSSQEAAQFETITARFISVLSAMCENNPDSVTTLSKNRDNLILSILTINCAQKLNEFVWSKHDTVVLTSATMSVGKDLSYIERKLGFHPHATYQYEAPFNYEQQMQVYVANDPDLLPGSDLYEEVLASHIQHCVQMTAGGSFVLFTNNHVMNKTYEIFQSNTENKEKYTLLIQGLHQKRDIVQQFQKHSNCILFGLDSFWSGVDIQGSHLRNVIITKLPFPAFQSPLNKHISQLIEQNGGHPFRDYMLPEAILKFRQGIGRLIRTKEDEGIIFILDPRLQEKTYGQKFLQSFSHGPIMNLNFITEIKS